VVRRATLAAAGLTHVLDDEDLERVTREAQFRGLFRVRSIRDAMTRRPSAALRELLGDLNPTQSQLEDAFLRLCRRHTIPKPQAQVRGGRRRPDFVWPEHRLVVEVDSWSAHSTRMRLKPTARCPTPCSWRVG
jgi:hypothetical protein